MAWDFCTDPDLQRHLDLIREVVVDRIEPLDLVKHELATTNR